MTEKETDKYINQRVDEGDDDLIDQEVLESFAEDQLLDHGSDLARRRRQQHTDKSPELEAGDADSTWDDADGEEPGDGAAPTTDENVTDEVGEAAGLLYSDTEPLHTGDKMDQREHHRWELDPASDLDYQERIKEEFHNAKF